MSAAAFFMQQIPKLQASRLHVLQERVRGQKYDALIAEVLTALSQRYGNTLLVHWEDFSAKNSYRLLSSARSKVCYCWKIVCGMPTSDSMILVCRVEIMLMEADYEGSSNNDR